MTRSYAVTYTLQGREYTIRLDATCSLTPRHCERVIRRAHIDATVRRVRRIAVEGR